MDDRRKRISELEHRKREQIAHLDALLIRLGESLFIRMSDSISSCVEELAVYKGYQIDIENSQVSIQAAEEQIRRSKELDESIEAKEREESENTKGLTVLYSKLGKLLLEDNTGEYADFCLPYREQNEALLTKVFSLAERLDELDKKEGGNVFTWIGKSAQGLVLRSFLTKAQENLEQLRRNVGDRYSRSDAGKSSGGDHTDNAGITGLCCDIEQKRLLSSALSADIAELREERRMISNSFSAEGGPVRYINTIKNHIANVQNELKILYRRMGAETALIDPVSAAASSILAKDPPSERRQIIDSLVLDQDREAMDTASRINRTIHDIEKEIEKLEASLAIDEEKAKIDKFHKMILEKREKIARAEQNIAEYEEGIRYSEACIEKLQDLL